jgi:hypothetical protein
MKYIYHHLGLGDHIICNGIVRHYQEIYDDVTVFCKPCYSTNVKYMYRDNQKIIVLPIGEKSDVVDYINQNNIESDLIVVGFDKPGFNTTKTFDEWFYNTVDLPFEYRFSKFKFERNNEKENEVYNELNPNNEQYIYVHDDKERGFEINRDELKSDLKIIENDKRFLMFDMLKIIENATEVHSMQTGMKDLINSFNFKKPNFYLHWYVRPYNDNYDSIGLNKFTKIY